MVLVVFLPAVFATQIASFMGPTSPGGSHVGPINLAVRVITLLPAIHIFDTLHINRCCFIVPSWWDAHECKFSLYVYVCIQNMYTISLNVVDNNIKLPIALIINGNAANTVIDCQFCIFFRIVTQSNSHRVSCYIIFFLILCLYSFCQSLFLAILLSSSFLYKN